MAAMGHEERFPPPRLSAGYAFRKQTIAGTRRNGQDAPFVIEANESRGSAQNAAFGAARPA